MRQIMTGLYFSGTGNTKHCVEEFVRCFDSSNKAFSIETAEIEKLLVDEKLIVFGHPVYFSNIPKIVGDFIKSRAKLFNNKSMFIIATMGLFSGDGAGCSARLFQKHGAKIIGGLHLKMPDCIGDVKLLKKSLEENKAIVKKADEKLNLTARKLQEGKSSNEGLNIFYHIAGLFGQRLWFYGKSLFYKNKPNIDRNKCTCCGLCVKNCPMKNLKTNSGNIIHEKMCTMCYRCVSNCPSQALTILGKQVYEQCLFEKYSVHKFQ